MRLGGGPFNVARLLMLTVRVPNSQHHMLTYRL